MLKYFLFTTLVFGTNAYAEDISIPGELIGNNCEITNNYGHNLELKQVRFNYGCSDGTTRRAPLKVDDVLIPLQTNSYKFPGHDNGCLNPFVYSCSAKGELESSR